MASYPKSSKETRSQQQKEPYTECSSTLRQQPLFTDLFGVTAVQNQSKRLNVKVKPHGLHRFFLVFVTPHCWLSRISCTREQINKSIELNHETELTVVIITQAEAEPDSFWTLYTCLYESGSVTPVGRPLAVGSCPLASCLYAAGSRLSASPRFSSRILSSIFKSS